MKPRKVPAIMLYHERKARKAGYTLIAGIDEAGRGPLAGPVVAACVILKGTNFKHRIDDSKKLTYKSRLKAFDEIREKSIFGIGIVGERTIDKINIYHATVLAMEMAVRDLRVSPECLLIDGRLRLDVPCEKICIIKGDTKSLSIASASIVAKVTRDRIMERYHKKYPHYGFKKHKGYGTKAHRDALTKYGPSPIHRTTFRPVKNLLHIEL